MSIPSKKRRTIVVDSTQWEYCVSGYIGIYLKNLTTNDQFKWWMDVKPKWYYSFKPSEVRELIQTGVMCGRTWIKVS